MPPGLGAWAFNLLKNLCMVLNIENTVYLFCQLMKHTLIWILCTPRFENYFSQWGFQQQNTSNLSAFKSRYRRCHCSFVLHASTPVDVLERNLGLSILAKDTWAYSGAAMDRTASLPISRWPALPPELQPTQSYAVYFLTLKNHPTSAKNSGTKFLHRDVKTQLSQMLDWSSCCQGWHNQPRFRGSLDN